MVLAEVPLWFVHTNAAAASSTDFLSSSSSSSSSNPSRNRDASDNAATTSSTANRARESMSLLETIGGGAKKKCAVYSVDIHPQGKKFATGGGDGKVRLWSTAALFAKHRGSYTEGGNYVSSSAGESSSDEGDGGDGDRDRSSKSVAEDGNDDTGDGDRADGDGDGDGVGDGDGENDNSPKMESSGPVEGASAGGEVVNDLNGLVRRKKGAATTASASAGASGSSSPPTPTPTDAAEPTNKTNRTNSKANNNEAAKPPTPALSSNRTPKKECDRLLCTLSAHTGSSVLAVRFSTSGQYLASAGDDAIVCIYTPSSSTPFASGGSGNLVPESQHHVEQWSRIKLCRGHTLDVVGLAWAPDDSHLVSCSLDSDAPIIVWKLTDLTDAHNQRSNLNKHDAAYHYNRPSPIPHSSKNVLVNPYKILGKKVHTSTVKGVTFDPAGTYLASSGDDPAVCIWRAHDDWGLEKKIDASSGIFRRWKDDGNDNDNQNQPLAGVGELSSQSLFRRLSWSTDGTHICSTNSTVNNKHVASTISREGWGVSSARGGAAGGDVAAATGAANLVGHKQPVVVSRHCPYLLDAKKPRSSNANNGNAEDDMEEDDEPDYATLIALGDRRGFLTVWSTRKSRPLFKLQCSESRCTVTDIAWGRLGGGSSMLLLVTLLDGYTVALRFRVPEEIGPILSNADQNRVFQLRYGIDLDDDNGYGRRKLFVGNSSGPKLIENALQLSLENRNDVDDDNRMDISFGGDPSATQRPREKSQVESRKDGKKRIQPVLLSVDSSVADKRLKTNGADHRGENGAKRKEKKKSNAVQDALESADKIASAAEGISSRASKQPPKPDGKKEAGADSDRGETLASHQHPRRPQNESWSSPFSVPQIPHSTHRIHSVDLPIAQPSEKIVADCTNTMRIPKGSSGQPLQCLSVSINVAGRVNWREEIVGTYCCAVAACRSLLAVGTVEGSVHLYGTSPTTGWKSAIAFRSHAPLVFGQPIVSLELYDTEGKEAGSKSIELLLVTSDGSFGVYTIFPGLSLKYKGSIMPAMTHMILSSSGGTIAPNAVLPSLARIQITEKQVLLMILGSDSAMSSDTSNHTAGAGGSLQGFVYNKSLEVWMRVADSRFVLSDLYSLLPTVESELRKEPLFGIDIAVRSGVVSSTLKPSRRGRGADSEASGLLKGGEERGNVATRSHCEDRIACAVALGSKKEFEFWLSQYVDTLSSAGFVDQLRLVVDLLLGNEKLEQPSSSCWWLSSAPSVLALDRRTLVRDRVIPMMSKNRSLQRITNEISLELEAT